jgi:hypothetical protein
MSAQDISIADVCAFLETGTGDLEGGDSSALGFGAMPPPQHQQLPPPPGHKTMSTADSNGSADETRGMSHICNWPGCGKGFASRWSLERHMKNHQPVTPGEEEPQCDSFVERRLRERLKSVQQALDKAREKLAQNGQQQHAADVELSEARIASEQTQAELQALAQQNQRLTARLSPSVAQQIIAAVECQRSLESAGVLPSANSSCGSGSTVSAAGDVELDAPMHDESACAQQPQERQDIIEPSVFSGRVPDEHPISDQERLGIL